MSRRSPPTGVVIVPRETSDVFEVEQPRASTMTDTIVSRSPIALVQEPMQDASANDFEVECSFGEQLKSNLPDATEFVATVVRDRTLNPLNVPMAEIEVPKRHLKCTISRDERRGCLTRVGVTIATTAPGSHVKNWRVPCWCMSICCLATLWAMFWVLATIIEAENLKPAAKPRHYGVYSCAQLQAHGIEVDGEYHVTCRNLDRLVFQNDTQKQIKIKVYCHGMKTKAPAEYLTLPASLQDPESNVFRSLGMQTRWSKVRIDPCNLKLNVLDDTFAHDDTETNWWALKKSTPADLYPHISKLSNKSVNKWSNGSDSRTNCHPGITRTSVPFGVVATCHCTQSVCMSKETGENGAQGSKFKVELQNNLCDDIGESLQPAMIGKGKNKKNRIGCFNWCLVSHGCTHFSFHPGGWCIRYLSCTPRKNPVGSERLYTTYKLLGLGCAGRASGVLDLRGTQFATSTTWLSTGLRRRGKMYKSHAAQVVHLSDGGCSGGVLPRQLTYADFAIIQKQDWPARHEFEMCHAWAIQLYPLSRPDAANRLDGYRYIGTGQPVSRHGGVLPRYQQDIRITNGVTGLEACQSMCDVTANCVAVSYRASEQCDRSQPHDECTMCALYVDTGNRKNPPPLLGWHTFAGTTKELPVTTTSHPSSWKSFLKNSECTDYCSLWNKALVENCRCSFPSLKEFVPGRQPTVNTVAKCGRQCQLHPRCKSFGLWTHVPRPHSPRACALFTEKCTSATCSKHPTNVRAGYHNEVFNMQSASGFG